MLQRVWRCTIDLDRTEEYEEFARNVSLPMFRLQLGFCGCLMSRRDGECEVLTLWEDEESVNALETSETYLSTVAQIRDAGFIQAEKGSSVSQLHLVVTDQIAIVGGRARPKLGINAH